MPVVSKKQLAEILLKTDKFFTVRFSKKDNTLRTMNCRNHVAKHLAGGELSYDPKEKGLIVTYSIDAKGYRSIPIEGLIGASVEGETYLTR